VVPEACRLPEPCGLPYLLQKRVQLDVQDLRESSSNAGRAPCRALLVTHKRRTDQKTQEQREVRSVEWPLQTARPRTDGMAKVTTSASTTAWRALGRSHGLRAAFDALALILDAVVLIVSLESQAAPPTEPPPDDVPMTAPELEPEFEPLLAMDAAHD
jgi:hypothetical protein